jgi:F420-non-reducing hydrogenase small subunit
MSKPKVGFYWCASCGGCEEAVVDLAETILDVAELVDIVFWPCAMDFKRQDVEAMHDGAMAASSTGPSAPANSARWPSCAAASRNC